MASTKTETSDENRRIFVAYPWELYDDRDAYKEAYLSLEKALAVKFVFAEERVSTGHVLDKIIGMIDETAFGIYDVSGWNANVTLEYGVARGSNADAYIAFNPHKTKPGDVPSDVRGYDRLQYTDLADLSDKIATLIGQVLGVGKSDPLEDDRQRLKSIIEKNPGKTARQLANKMDEKLDYVQLLLQRSKSELETDGRTRGTKYSIAES